MSASAGGAIAATGGVIEAAAGVSASIVVLFARTGVTIADAFVDSREVQQLPLVDRRLLPDGHPYPINLGGMADVTTVRKALIRCQAKVGRARDAKGGGNQRKAMRLLFDVANTVPAEALADLFAKGPAAVEDSDSLASS